eukprot:9615390-Prorocentrum_lima.AAC.1
MQSASGAYAVMETSSRPPERTSPAGWLRPERPSTHHAGQSTGAFHNPVSAEFLGRPMGTV